MVGGKAVAIGSLDLFDAAKVPEAVKNEVTRLQESGQTTMVIRRGQQFLGVIGVADTLRPEAKAALASLHALGIQKTVMLSGDNLRVAQAIGKEVGIDEPRAPLMPEGKVAALRELAKGGGVAMVGDGVNDAPALAAASVGIAMGGAGSDVALETADVVLMGDDLRQLPFAVALAREATRTVKVNLAVSLGIASLLIVASIMGWVRISHAVLLHEGSTMIVVLNGLRLLLFRA
jgi:Cd2+/Zn2+-exporting ATPase